MELAIIDAIGPFFRAVRPGRINWSKIAFSDVPWGAGSEGYWRGVRDEMSEYADRVAQAGFNAVTLDDVAHLVPHEYLEPAIRARAATLATEFHRLIDLLTARGLRVYLTTDYFVSSPAVDHAIGMGSDARRAFFCGMVGDFLDAFPSVEGVILRVGESDGVDVRDPLRSTLAARSAPSVNRLLRDVLPEFERRNRRLVFRTWAVGAGMAGDLIWHRGRLRDVLHGARSPALIVSMKPGESDFFRYLPVNGQFFRTELPKLIELQARREYEGAGEFPAFIGRECERLAGILRDVPNMAGFSVWGQTGGWHRFRRRAYIGAGAPWVEINAEAAVAIFRHGESVEKFLARKLGPDSGASEFFDLCDRIIENLYYIAGFARQKLFFRRVRIPPLIHIYWDRIFIVEPVREILRHYVSDREGALREGEEAFGLFPRVRALAERLGLPVEDIDFMRDTCEVIRQARRYYFLPFTPGLAAEIRAAKAAYKAAWPKSLRPRYRVKLSFHPTPVRSRLTALVMKLAVRRRRGYRMFLDRLVTLNVLSWAYRVFAAGYRRRVPKFLRKSAMGVDAVLK
jgi:hypothetical protein